MASDSRRMFFTIELFRRCSRSQGPANSLRMFRPDTHPARYLVRQGRTVGNNNAVTQTPSTVAGSPLRSPGRQVESRPAWGRERDPMLRLLPLPHVSLVLLGA